MTRVFGTTFGVKQVVAKRYISSSLCSRSKLKVCVCGGGRGFVGLGDRLLVGARSLSDLTSLCSLLGSLVLHAGFLKVIARLFWAIFGEGFIKSSVG